MLGIDGSSSMQHHMICIVGVVLLVIVLPLVEVVVVEVPDLSSGSGDDGGDSLQLLDDNQTTVALVNEQASFQWTCSVQAGAGDELAWLHNGIPVPLAQSASQEVSSLCDSSD